MKQLKEMFILTYGLDAVVHQYEGSVVMGKACGSESRKEAYL